MLSISISVSLYFSNKLYAVTILFSFSFRDDSISFNLFSITFCFSSCVKYKNLIQESILENTGSQILTIASSILLKLDVRMKIQFETSTL